MMGKVQKEMGEMGNLIAYYSREGNNYVDGSIVNLPIGNTEVAAKMIQKLTDGDTFRIDTVEYDFSGKTIIPYLIQQICRYADRCRHLDFCSLGKLPGLCINTESCYVIGVLVCDKQEGAARIDHKIARRPASGWLTSDIS